MAANYRLIAVQVGDSLKYATSINEINRIAGAIFPFRCENFQNNSITSSRAKLVHDWILSLASQKMGEDERNRLLKTFCYQLCSEDSLRATVHSILQAANIPLEEENKDNGEMIINLDNLKSGLQWWRKRDWPQDIHNADYYDIYNTRAAGPTEEWWRATVDRLSQWRAYQGPKPPNTKADISERGTRNLVGITSQYWKLIASTGTEPSIAYLNWEDVAPLFAIASDIKPVSPVFAGKMCHFLFPRLFIVMDNLATSVFDYEFYWRGMKDEWSQFKEKAEAQNLLEEAIRSDKPLHPLYPFETKIMELSHMDTNINRSNHASHRIANRGGIRKP